MLASLRPFVAVFVFVAPAYAVIGALVAYVHPSVRLNLFVLVACALNGDVLGATAMSRSKRRWAWWLLIVLANAPLIVRVIQVFRS